AFSAMTVINLGCPPHCTVAPLSLTICAHFAASTLRNWRKPSGVPFRFLTDGDETFLEIRILQYAQKLAMQFHLHVARNAPGPGHPEPCHYFIAFDSCFGDRWNVG